VLGLLALAACHPTPTRTTPAADARTTSLPSTQADPIAYTPPPSRDATTGGPVGLATSGGRQAARALTLSLLEAVRIGDPDELRRLLSGPLARTLPRVSERRNPAEALITEILDPRHRQAAGTAHALSTLIDLEHLDARPLTERLRGRAFPEGLAPTDLFVVVPLTPEGRRFFGSLLPGWRLVGGVIARPGATPRILGL